MRLDFCFEIIKSHKKHGSVDPFWLVSAVQAAVRGVIVWGIFSCHTLRPLVPTEQRWLIILNEFCC